MHFAFCNALLPKVSTPDFGDRSRRPQPYSLPAERRQVIFASLCLGALLTRPVYALCGSPFHCAGHFYECVSLSCVSILAKVSTPDLRREPHAGHRHSLCRQGNAQSISHVALLLRLARPVYALWIVIPLCRVLHGECVSSLVSGY